MSEPLKIVPIRDPLLSLQDISGWLRRLADEIDACDGSDVRTLLLVNIDQDGKIGSRCFGDNPTRAEVVGYFQMAAIKAASGDWSE